MKKTFLILFIILVILVGGFFIFRRGAAKQQNNLIASLETAKVERGTLTSTVGASGVLQSSQNALLFWQSSGQVGQVLVGPGDQVSAGDVLATLEASSLPSVIILAQADLVNSQKALDDLLHSQTQHAEALKAVDEAEKALEDAFHPASTQAQAQAAVAQAEKAVETAQRNYEIVTAIPSQSAIDQAYANLLLAKDRRDQSLEQVTKLEQQIKTAGSGLPPQFQEQIRRALKQALKGLRIQQTQDELTYEHSLGRYNALLEPPDPIEVAEAEATLVTAKARLEDANRQWERVKDGVTPAEIALLQAELADARRKLERVENGPDPDEIAILEARIAAAQATLRTIQITAPFDGTITAAEAQPGDQVSPGTLAFRLDDLSRLEVEIGISEIDINKIEIGQEALLTFESVFAREYHGVVAETSAVGAASAGAVTFAVRVELLDADENIKPGMTSEVQIVTSKIEDALLIPSQAIRSENGETVVYVVDAGIFNGQSTLTNGIRAVPITVGEFSNSLSEVIEGDLSPGDEVLINIPAGISSVSQGSGVSIRIEP